MLTLLLGFALIALGLAAMTGRLLLKSRRLPSVATPVFGSLSIAFGVLSLASVSFVWIGAAEVGHLKRIYMADDLPAGRILALPGQKGPQTDILGPGFHFIPLVDVLYDVETFPVIEVAVGQYGLLTAKDGHPLRDGQFIADEWLETDFENMLDAGHFLTAGNGQKGPQMTVLRPGQYRLNQYLFEVQLRNATDVDTGHVAVVRSNVSRLDADCPNVIKTAVSTANSQVAAPIVPRGCMGVWNEPLPPGRYYLNELAYVVTVIPTRIQTWKYQGGYLQRNVKLVIGDDGSITQDFSEVERPIPDEAADGAITVRVEGWTVPVELRVLVTVQPNLAPTVVATVGDLTEVENKIITPAIRDVLRTIGGAADRQVMDFIESRDALSDLVEAVIVPEGLKAGVTIQEVRIGEPAIPPELMVARLREQLAGQLRETYLEEQKTQRERIAVERERATANQQASLVEAEIAKQAAGHRREQLRLEGEGEKLKLIEIAQGQKAQAGVLGEDKVLQLQLLKEILAVAAANPDIIKVPMVHVAGDGSLEGAAAVLGASSNLSALVQGGQKPPAE
ncbi:MAG: SPFH domain-containing protein [Xanthomonadales bacterium]|nr:SPFH domain-containing protein [Xanthomonadales bacterium]